MFRVGKKFSKPTLSRIINGDLVVDQTIVASPKIRLDHLLKQQFPDYHRATLQKFIKAGYVSADQIVVLKPNLLLDPDVKLSLNLPEFKKQQRPPVIYEDDHILVLNKPAGLLSAKKSQHSFESTLEDFGHLVHRLDRDTSGVVILTKDLDTKAFLQQQFQDRQVKKTYFAVTSATPKHSAAKISLPIARNLKHPTTFEINPSGREAITQYRVLESKVNPLRVLFALQPLTGRTHQLRVHLKYLGTPILGDPIYGGDKFSRLMLHAASVEINLPNQGAKSSSKTFVAPLPEEFSAIFPNIPDSYVF